MSFIEAHAQRRHDGGQRQTGGRYVQQDGKDVHHHGTGDPPSIGRAFRRDACPQAAGCAAGGRIRKGRSGPANSHVQTPRMGFRRESARTALRQPCTDATVWQRPDLLLTTGTKPKPATIKVNNAVDAVTLPPDSCHQSVDSVHAVDLPPTLGHRV